MLLAIDIGNTNISFGIFKAERLIKRFNIPTGRYSFSKLKIALGNAVVRDAVICSVVPPTSRLVERDVKRLLDKSPYVLGKDIKVPIKNLYRKPKQVGQDRLVNAFAGCSFYGAPLIIVDFGTAITFDVISKNKEYLGGMIIPGLKISLETLFEKTALLPRIKLNAPKDFIGRDTKSSMLSGIVYGFAALTDDLTQRIKEKIGKTAKVVGTGGDVSLIGTYCKNLDRIDRDLTLKGVRLCLENLL